MALKHIKDTGVDLNTDDAALAAHLLIDALAALKSNPNALGWYNETVCAAMAVLELIHPEVESDPTARFAFTLDAIGMGVSVSCG